MTEAQPQEQTLRGYPYMANGTWAQIRARLKSSIPKSISADWLQSVLNISAKNAGNVSPQLRRLGLIDKDGTPQQPLVNDLREEDTYAAACARMIESVYPQALLDAFPAPHDDPDGVAGWFRRNANTGERMAAFQARFLALLSSGVPPVPGERPARKSASPAKKTAATPAKKTARSTTPKTTVDQSQGERNEATYQRDENDGPSVHIDVQIHIDANAQAEQIDAVFASMARHLYGK